MIKFRELGAYKNAKNIGYCVAEAVMKNGQAAEFDLTDCTANHPSTAKADGLAIVMNSIEKPEILEPNDYTIEIGEYPRLFTLKSIEGEILDMDMDQIDGQYSDIDEGVTLTPKTDGTWEVQDTLTGYPAYLEVVDLNTYGGAGFGAKVVIVDKT